MKKGCDSMGDLVHWFDWFKNIGEKSGFKTLGKSIFFNIWEKSVQFDAQFGARFDWETMMFVKFCEFLWSLRQKVFFQKCFFAVRKND